MRRLFVRSGLAVVLAAVAALPLAAAAEEEFAAVTNRVIYPGETIPADAVEEVPLVRGNRNLGPIFQQATALGGMVARRTILPGRLIPQNAVRPAYLIEAGAPVQVVYSNGGLTITATAVALEPGAAGDVVRLRNVESGRTFTGTVMTDGSIRVDPA